MTCGLHGCTFVGPKLAGLLAVVVLTAVGLPRATAGDNETRDFTIFIDGKNAGEYHLTVDKKDDGTTHVQAQARVKVSYLVKTYKFSFDGHEVWKDGRLQKFDSQTNDDGTELSVAATAENNGLRVRCKSGERVTRGDVWVTTYWHQPDAKLVDKGVALLEGDTGKDLTATLQYVGQSEVNVGGQNQVCNRYRLRGGVAVDMWYDRQGRIVRQESDEDGHRMILQLTGTR